MPASCDLTEAQRATIAFRNERDWKQFHSPKNLVAGLAIEAAELQETLLWEDTKPADEVVADAGRLTKIRAEMADVAIYLLTLAHDLDVDLPAAILEKLADNARRYPPAQYRGRSDKAPH